MPEKTFLQNVVRSYGGQVQEAQCKKMMLGELLLMALAGSVLHGLS